MAIEKVLTGILFVLSEGCTWRGIDAPHARWNSIYQYYRRWCRNGLWEAVWESVSPAAAPDTVYLDSTFIKVHRSGLNPEGGRDTQALGRTKGGWNSKVHAVVDRHGTPRALFLSGGQVADISHARDLLEELPKLPTRMVVADKAYDSDALRVWLLERDITPCIPPKSNRQSPLPYRQASYRRRPRVENCFAHLKTFRRVATRYDKLAETFFGWVLLAVIIKFGL